MLPHEKAKAIFEELPLLYRVACAIICTKKIQISSWWNLWADRWLSGEDRTEAYAYSLLACSHGRGRGDAEIAERYALRAAIANAGDILGCKGDLDSVLEWVDRIEFNKYPAALFKRRPYPLVEVLEKYFICPYCYKQPDQHIKSGKCLFGAHTWKNINNAWRP